MMVVLALVVPKPFGIFAEHADGKSSSMRTYVKPWGRPGYKNKGRSKGPEVVHYPKTPGEIKQKSHPNSRPENKRKVLNGPCFEIDTDYFGNDVDGGHEAETAEACQIQCTEQEKCNYFTFEVELKRCWLKNTKIGRRPAAKKGALISGPRNCSENFEERDMFDSYDSVEAASDAIVSAFKHAWKGYTTYCFGQDELRPISKSCINDFGLGLTLIDTLDSLYIVGLKDEFEKAKNWVSSSLHFDVNKDVSVFETIIRVLGGLLSAHALTKSEVFLDKALQLAGRLEPALRGKVPESKINLKTSKISRHSWSPGNYIIAEVGSLQLEMWYLSKASGQPKWNDYAEGVIRYLDSLPTQTPGLYPTMLAPGGRFSQQHISFGALGDSMYEYLLKMWILKGKKDDDIYRRMYLRSMESMMNKLLVKSKDDLWYIAEMRGNKLDHKMDHLTCFAPGMLALGYHHSVGKDAATNERHLMAAKDVAETCVQMYMRWPISPEMVRFTPYMTLGTGYNLMRPETVESMFVLWQVTKDERWRKYGWTIFQKFERHLKVDNGYVGLSHVGDPNSRSDKMESFLLAETYKYLYLLFQDDPSITLDTYVFNTEAHPLPIPQ